MTDRQVKSRLLFVVMLVISISSVCGQDELKHSFVDKDSRNITITYKNIGCFKDKADPRALPNMLSDFRTEEKIDDIISKCAKLAWMGGHQGFGVQFLGECWVGKNALQRYDMYNTTDSCDARGIGGHWCNSIYFFTNTTPLMIAGPRPWRGISGSNIELSCRFKSPFDINVTWYRNNDDEDSVYTGDNFKVPSVATEQGYYRCKATTPYGVEVQSDKVLVILDDYFTSIVKFKLKRPSRSTRSLRYCIPCDEIVNYLTDRNSEMYYRGACRTWSVSEKVEVECTIYRQKNNQDIKDYYDNLRSSLTQAARRGKLRGIQWRSIVVNDAEHCVQESTGKTGFKGIFDWPMLTSGQSRDIVCPYGPRDANATRSCTGDYIRGVAWKDPDVQNCGFTSKKTENLSKLSTIQVNTQNVLKIAKNVTKIFQSQPVEDFTESDAKLAADIIQNCVGVKEKLSETADSVLEIVDTIMNMNKTMLAKSETTSTKITKALDTLAENIPMEKGKTSRVFKTRNLVLQANDITKESYQGISFSVSKDGSIAANPEQPNTSVKLPPSLLTNTEKDSVRVGFIYYANNKFFQEVVHDQEHHENQSKPNQANQILSSSVYNTNTSTLPDPVILRFPVPEQKEDKNPLNSSCVFWNEDLRLWSDAGCKLCDKNDDTEDGAVECCCNHLTSFAVLFSPGSPKPSTQAYKKHELALSIITYVGCAISLGGVLLTFLTYSLFRHLRKTNQQPILMNLCIAIALLLIVFVAGINSTDDILGCQIVAVLLHYLTLVTVVWMGIEAYNLYLQIVKVMAIYQRKFMLKAAIVGWGAPLVIVLSTVIAATVEYKQDTRLEKKTFKYGSNYACVLHDDLYRIIGWFAPILGILLFNLITFILVVYKLNCTGAMIPVDTKSHQRRRCWTALAIMCLLGLTWLFGALAISDARIVFEYLFCIFNSLQGFFIFFFHCVRIKEVRSQWSFFVSGLGFSHRESETSHQRSKGFGESQHSSEAFIKVRNWINKDSEEHSDTVYTNESSKRDGERYTIPPGNGTGTGNNNSFMLYNQS